MFTILCVCLKAVIHCAWLPFIGLLWWYRFTYNLINDLDGRTIYDIFEESSYSSDIYRQWLPSDPLFYKNSSPLNRYSRSIKRQYPGIKHTTTIPASMTPFDHRRIKKLESYYTIDLPDAPLTSAIDNHLHHIWTTHSNARFYREMSTIFFSLWLATGFRLIKLLFMILMQWNEKLSVRMAYCYKLKPPVMWTYYRRKH